MARIVLFLILTGICMPASYAASEAIPRDDSAEEESAGPSKEAVAETVANLKAAIKEGQEDKLVTACAAAAMVPHEDVVRQLELVLELRRKEEQAKPLRRAALNALGQVGLPSSLKVLHKSLRKSKALRKDPDLAVLLLKAIASHEDPSSIEVLGEALDSTPGKEALQARILGLGRIRSKASIDALVNLMTRATKGRSVRQMGDFRLAFVVLTGVDKGSESNAWMRWWSDAEKDFEIAVAIPPIPRELDARWRRYWGFEEADRRGRRREDRGGR